MNILDSKIYKRVLLFKLVMMTTVWGLLPLLMPVSLFPFFGFSTSTTQILLLRLFGAFVLIDNFVYIYMYKKPHSQKTKKLIFIAILDNGLLAITLSILTPILSIPWSVTATIPFQIFFAYWFWRFYTQGYNKK